MATATYQLTWHGETIEFTGDFSGDATGTITGAGLDGTCGRDYHCRPAAAMVAAVERVDLAAGRLPADHPYEVYTPWRTNVEREIYNRMVVDGVPSNADIDADMSLIFADWQPAAE